jgi:hypothetical protein
MFSEFEQHASVLFPILVLNLSPDCVPDEIVDSSENNVGDNWTMQFLLSMSEELGLEIQSLAAYQPMIPHYDSDIEYLQTSQRSFLEKCTFTPYQWTMFICKLIAYLLIGKLYDGKGRTLLLNLTRNIGMSRHNFIYLEKKLYLFFLAHSDAIASFSGNIEHDLKKSKRKRYFRYAKIGAASLGAGAVLALTGGLAAPAIAAALVAFGTTTVAAAASVTTVACICGGTTAGLTGYKMMKRTRGLTEFQFEQYFEEVSWKLYYEVILNILYFYRIKQR